MMMSVAASYLKVYYIKLSGRHVANTLQVNTWTHGSLALYA